MKSPEAFIGTAFARSKTSQAQEKVAQSSEQLSLLRRSKTL
jgi:hypothetical protein